MSKFPTFGTPAETGPPLPGIIGSCPAMQRVYSLTRRVAKSNASVLLLGETGTGKERIASAVHALSRRTGGPFVQVNCGALSENLLESELFGHVRGTFTGAVSNRTGRFEAAHGGTIFLDEINSTTLHLQVKLLRVLQEREFQRVGDTQTLRTDTRIIAASNKSLRDLVQRGEFREDLYWRLNVVPIDLPPLRERRDDIPELVSYFLGQYSEANDRHVVHYSRQAMDLLQAYDWPGNVRELQNYIERAVVMAEGDELVADLLPDCIRGAVESPPQPEIKRDMDSLTEELVRQGLRKAAADEDSLHAKIVNRVEKEVIAQVLLSCNNIQKKAAQRLGINRNTLHSKIKFYDLET